MLKVTFDSNCIIDLERNSNTAPSLMKLIQMYRSKKILLRVVAIGGMERKRDHTYPTSLKEFKERISQVGLDNVEILPTACYQGMAFSGYSVHSGEQSRELESKIQEIMFPAVELNYADFCQKCHLNLDNKNAQKKWRNVKCDVLTLWSHILYKGDILVTKDKDFHRKLSNHASRRSALERF